MTIKTLIGTAVVSLLFGACVGKPFTEPADGPTVAQDGTSGGLDFPDLGPPPPKPDGGRCQEVIDLVFVLDISSSMSFVLDTLDAEIHKVVSAANKLKTGAHFGLVAFVDNHRLDKSGPLNGGVVHTAASTLQAAFRHYKQTYTSANRNPGDGPTGPTQQNPICEENANDALHAAATEFPWRTNATRVVIVVTDDTFLERPDNYGDRDGDGKTDKKDFPREGDYPAKRLLSETISELRKAQVRVFAFTRLLPPGFFDLLRCGTERRLPWSAVSQGWSQPYGANAPIPKATGGKNFDLNLVLGKQLSLTTTVNDVVLKSHCNPIL